MTDTEEKPDAKASENEDAVEAAEAASEEASERASEDASDEASEGASEEVPKAEVATRDEAKGEKKKKKKKSPTAELEDDSPEGKMLKEAQVAFEIGDYKTARELATKLTASTRAPIADAGRDLLRRTDVDPAQMIFLAACACALIGVAFYYLR
jgi:hypothetical protein